MTVKLESVALTLDGETYTFDIGKDVTAYDNLILGLDTVVRARKNGTRPETMGYSVKDADDVMVRIPRRRRWWE